MTDDDRSPLGAFGAGIATTTPDGRVLDVFFPEPRLGAGGPPAMADTLQADRVDELRGCGSPA
jgi:2,3,4,5-tetrahydropyridine-2-carboxylate N-succinyltransferase